MTCDLCVREVTSYSTNKKGYGTYCDYCVKIIDKLIDALREEEIKPPRDRRNLLECYVEFRRRILP